MKAIILTAILALSSYAFADSEQNQSMVNDESVQTQNAQTESVLVMNCTARNLRGEEFVGRALTGILAEQRALNACYSVSQRCWITSCHR